MTKGKKLAVGLGILVFLLAIVAIIFLINYHPRSHVSFVVDGTNFSAEVIDGGEMILTVPSNPTTGYSWVITKRANNFASDYNNYYSDDNSEGLVGVGGNTEFHIVALKEGEDTMTFQYKQDWEGGSVDSTYDLTLNISRQHKKYLQIEDVVFEKVG